VDIIETGFPLSSSIDFTASREIALELSERNIPTAVLCRGRPEDITKTAEIFSGGLPGLLHISLPVSKIHLEAKLGKTQTELLVLVRKLVSYAAGLVPMVELGAEDAGRADRVFLEDYTQTALEAGAVRVNIADTLGCLCPPEISELILFLRERVPVEKLSVHCHNDRGLALANTLAALEAGCGQAEISVLGLGERAGNAALEEVAANCALRPERYGHTGIAPEKLPALLELTQELTGIAGPLKAFAGWNVRAHASGIHQQGISRNRETYTPAEFESWVSVPERIVLSRHSGRAGIALFARRYLGLELERENCALLAERIKAADIRGLTEFLALLHELNIVPNCPTPLIMPEEIALNGEFNPAQVLEAVKNFTGREISLVKTAFSGMVRGICECMRLYAELSCGGRLYALERRGSSLNRLLFQCGLDAANAEAFREFLLSLNNAV
jgi:2-isopropylmalate synthase